MTRAGSIDHLGVRHQRGRLRVPLRAEAEDRGRRAEPRGEVGQRRDPDAAADEKRPLDVEPEAVPERPEDVDRVAGLQRSESASVPGPTGSTRNASSPAGREAEAHRPGQQPAGRLEHEELSGDPRVEPVPARP